VFVPPVLKLRGPLRPGALGRLPTLKAASVFMHHNNLLAIDIMFIFNDSTI